MIISKAVDSILQSFLHLFVDYLLSLLLDDVLGIVLTHFSVVRSSEADHGVRPRVANVDANQHCASLFHGLWKLHGEEVASSFAIDLLQYVGGLAEVEG